MANQLNIKLPSLIIINGSQGNGKSHLIKYIMSKYKDKFSYGLVITNTFFTQDSFKYIPRNLSIQNIMNKSLQTL